MHRVYYNPTTHEHEISNNFVHFRELGKCLKKGARTAKQKYTLVSWLTDKQNERH